MDLMDKKTGEVLEIVEPECPFRSITDLKGYNDDESYEPGTSQVDLTGYEPLESIIARCTRVMRAPGGQTYTVIDRDLVKQEAGVVPTLEEDYTAGSATTVDEAFDTADPTDDPDFDMTDAIRILSEIKERNDAGNGGIAPQIANDDVDEQKLIDEKLNEKDEEDDQVEKKATA